MQKIFRQRPWLVALALALLLGGALRAFVYETGSNGAPIHWRFNAPIPMYLGLGTPAAPLLDGSTTWNQVAQAALSDWNPNLGSGVSFQAQTAGAVGLNNGRNDVSFSATAFGQAFGSAVAITSYSYNGSNQFIEADVVFDQSRQWNSYRGPIRGVGGVTLYDLKRVALHEFGHVLCLDHPDQAGQTVTAVMNSRVSNTDALQADDINGVRGVYGAPGVTPTPTPLPTPAPTPPPTGDGRLINVSTRLFVSSGVNTGIGGFVVSGSGTKRFAIRALGPSLAAFGVTGAMNDPTLTVANSSGATVAANDDWQSGASASTLQALGLAPTSSFESALVVTLSPGSYTALVTPSAGSGSGVGLVEVYELDGAGSATAVNVSTRGFVGTGENVLIGGFVIGGSTSRRIVIRALGPTLASAGVSGALANPSLQLNNAAGVQIAANDNWAADPNAALLTSLGLAPGNSAEAATVVTLAPGAYTVIVRGVNSGTGVALVEVYDAP